MLPWLPVRLFVTRVQVFKPFSACVLLLILGSCSDNKVPVNEPQTKYPDVPPFSVTDPDYGKF